MVIGVDPDTRQIAYAAVVDGEVVGVRTIPRANQRGIVRRGYEAALQALMDRARDRGAMIFIEGIYLPMDRKQANVRGFAALAEVQGEIKSAARRADLEAVSVTAGEWHSAVLGFTKGRECLKAAARQKAESLFVGEWSEHECDAICVAMYGWGQAARVLPGVGERTGQA